jgi:hypothetical protein
VKGTFVKCLNYCLWMLVLAAMAIIVAACKQKIEEKLPLLQKEPLLLRNDDSALAADNSRCHVCHINYEDEKLAVTHARAGIGCEQCHGASDAHCSDEDNITPPDIMYPADKVNSFCKGCHPKAQLGGGKKYCTDCHGEHRLNHRTRRWDKSTGQLIEDDKVRMLTEDMLQ